MRGILSDDAYKIGLICEGNARFSLYQFVVLLKNRSKLDPQGNFCEWMTFSLKHVDKRYTRLNLRTFPAVWFMTFGSVGFLISFFYNF
jgi:hypothetical protein